jgi:organic radical activating enzyme
MDFTPGRPLRFYTETGKFADMSTDSLVGQKLNFFKGWTCGLGVENIFVDMDGNIYGASCRLGGKLGNIYEDFQVPEKWLTCTKSLCSCGADLFIPKARDEGTKSLLRKTFPELPPTDLSPLPDDATADFAALERVHDSALKQVYWEIGRRCNYDCSYCWPWIHNSTDKHKNLTQLIRATMLVEERFCRGASAHFVISGGEPTVNPDLLDWIKFIHSLGHKTSMHSNGSRLPEYYRELIRYTNLNLSAHFEFYKRDRFLKVVEAVTREKVMRKNRGVGHLEVKLMMKPGTREEAMSLERDLKTIPDFKAYCTWAIVPIRDGQKGDLIKEGYEERDFELFGDRA